MLGNRLFVANKKARRFYKKVYSYLDDRYPYYRRDLSREIGVMRKTRVRCSGYCCGNPRRHWGKVTRQEMRWLLNLRDWIYEC